MVLQLPIRRIVRYECVLHDVDESRAELADSDLANLRRETGPQRIKLSDDFFVLSIGVGKRLKFDDGERDTVCHDALELFDVIEFGKSILERFRNQSFQIFRVSARHDRGDFESRNLERGIFFSRHGYEAVETEYYQTEKNDQSELVASNRKFENGCRHEILTSLARSRGGTRRAVYDAYSLTVDEIQGALGDHAFTRLETLR